MQRLHDGLRVEAYWNLRRKTWSIRYKGRVIAHKTALTLRDVTWVVQPAGRDRVRRERRKNVHAMARGTVHMPKHPDPVQWNRYCASITYNPYKHDQFVYCEDDHPIRKSQMGFLSTTFIVTRDTRIPSVQILGHIA